MGNKPSACSATLIFTNFWNSLVSCLLTLCYFTFYRTLGRSYLVTWTKNTSFPYNFLLVSHTKIGPIHNNVQFLQPTLPIDFNVFLTIQANCLTLNRKLQDDDVTETDKRHVANWHAVRRRTSLWTSKNGRWGHASFYWACTLHASSICIKSHCLISTLSHNINTVLTTLTHFHTTVTNFTQHKSISHITKISNDINKFSQNISEFSQNIFTFSHFHRTDFTPQ